MIVCGFPVGMLQANTYIVGDKKSGQAFVIDPGAEAERILSVCAEKKVVVKRILLTHGHPDHVGAAAALKSATGATIHCHEAEFPILRALPQMGQQIGMLDLEIPVVDQFLEDGQAVSVGNLSIKVIHTPGHSPGGLCFYAHPCLFTGDTVFQGTVGRTDLPGGDSAALIASIRAKILTLDDVVVVLPGHNGKTSVGAERRQNPFLQRP